MEPFTSTLAHDLTLLRGLRHSLDSWLELAGAPVEARASIVLATHEAMANAMQHGESGAPVTVRAEQDAEKGFMVMVFNKGSWKEPEPGRVKRGRGLLLMTGLMSDVDIHAGTKVRMRHDR